MTVQIKYYYFKGKILKGEKIRHSLTNEDSQSSIANSESANTDGILKGLAANKLKEENDNIFGFDHNDLSIIWTTQAGSNNHKERIRNSGLESKFENLKMLFQKKKKSHFELEETGKFERWKIEGDQLLKCFPQKNALKSNLKILKPAPKVDDVILTNLVSHKNEVTLSNLIEFLNSENDKKTKFIESKFSGNASATRTEKSQKNENSELKFSKLKSGNFGAKLNVDFNAILKSSYSQISSTIQKDVVCKKVTEKPINLKNPESINSDVYLPSKKPDNQFLKSKKKSEEIFQPVFVGKIKNFLKRNFEDKKKLKSPKLNDLKSENNDQKPVDFQLAKNLGTEKASVINKLSLQNKKGSLQRAQSLKVLGFNQKKDFIEGTNKEKRTNKSPDKNKSKLILPFFPKTNRNEKNSNNLGKSSERIYQRLTSVNFRNNSNFYARNSLSRKLSLKNEHFFCKNLSEFPQKKQFKLKLNLFDRKINGESVLSNRYKVSTSVKPSFEILKVKSSMSKFPIKLSQKLTESKEPTNWGLNNPQKFSLNHLKKKIENGNAKTEINHPGKKVVDDNIFGTRDVVSLKEQVARKIENRKNSKDKFSKK